MPALVAGIHVFRPCNNKDVDGRNKSGHDDANVGHYLSVVMPGLVPGIHVLP